METSPHSQQRSRAQGIAERLPLPDGTFSIGGGLLINGLSSYAFFKVGQQALGQEGFKPIVALWFATFALAPGFFGPIEQEVGRALAHRRALNQGGRPVLQRVIPLTIGLGVIITLVLAGTSPWLNTEFFEENAVVTFSLIIGFLAYAPAHLSRGICSGSGRFGSYGVIMGADGLTRIIGCVILWQAGVTSLIPYAFVVALAPLVGVMIAGAQGNLKTDDGPEASWAEVTPNLGWLLIGAIVAGALVNAGPIAVDILADADQADAVTKFGNGVLLSRIPLFLFQAVQAALLPRLARLAAVGDMDEFRSGFKKLMYVVFSVAIVGVAGSFLVGPKVLEMLYDGGLDRRTLTLLALGSGIYMIALGTAQAVIALHGHAWVAAGWLLSMITFILVTAYASDDLYLRVELGLASASTAALAVFVIALRARLTSDVTIDEESVIEAFGEQPLEG